MAQEHQEYIQTKVNPTLENLVTQVLLERPDNPVPFMIQWLAQQTKASPQLDTGEAERLRNEISALQAEVGELEAKLGPGAAGAAAAAASPSPPPAAAEEERAGSKESAGSAKRAGSKEKAKDDSEEEDDDDDDAPDDFAPPPAYMQQKQRASVSAEAYGSWNKVKDFVPPVHPKTEEQKARLTSVLNSSWLFQTLDKASLDVILGAMIEKEIAANERIIQEGADGDVMFVIEKGAIECLKKLQGEEKVVKKCGPGDFFGELALLYNCPRAASVEARDPAVIWELDRETFNHIVKDASMKKRETLEAFLKSAPILESLGNSDRNSLADSLKQELVAAGTTVIKEGDAGNRFYLVLKGELTASKDQGQREVMQYKPGDYFGELALIKDEPRAATVVATTECELLWLDTQIFNSLLSSLVDVMHKKAADYAA